MVTSKHVAVVKVAAAAHDPLPLTVGSLRLTFFRSFYIVPFKLRVKHVRQGERRLRQDANDEEERERVRT